jgi:chromosome partitioning protein
MAKIIAFANQKGGVGKTTTAVNLGAELAAEGKRVLICDLDAQADLTFGLLGDEYEAEQVGPNLYSVLTGAAGTLQEIIKPTQWSNLDLLPGTMDMTGFELVIALRMGRESLLKPLLAPLAETYDYILFDCGPSLDLITINVLTASHYVIIPVQAEPRSVRATGRMLDAIGKVKTKMGHRRLTVLGLLLTMVAVNNVSRESVATLKASYGDLVFETTVARRVKLAEDTLYQAPLAAFAPRSDSANEMRQLAAEIANRIGKVVADGKK